ncbi:MAG: hypothetical protein WDA75_26165, partial [Candidatus Latescibacterota bacterium]
GAGSLYLGLGQSCEGLGDLSEAADAYAVYAGLASMSPLEMSRWQAKIAELRARPDSASR